MIVIVPPISLTRLDEYAKVIAEQIRAGNDQEENADNNNDDDDGFMRRRGGGGGAMKAFAKAHKGRPGWIPVLGIEVSTFQT